MVVALAELGLSAESFETVARLSAHVAQVRGVDLPGFGDAAAERGFEVSEMAEHVVRESRPRRLGRWFLLGHGLGGKVVSLLAPARATATRLLPGLAGVLLLAPSPPGPEPLSEERRGRCSAGWNPGRCPRWRPGSSSP